MKLWIKIFISILLISLTALTAGSYYLINQNHLENVAKEQERSINDLEFIRSSLEKSIDVALANDNSLQLLLSRYADFYGARGISLMLYHNTTPVYVKFTGVSEERYENLLTVSDHSKQVQIFEEAKQHYILVSGTLSIDGYVLVYARNINDIYQARTRSISLSLLLIAGFTVILGLLSYRYSRWITKPLETLNQGAIAISKGNYSIQIPQSKDEFNELGTAFNKMAAAIESRTKELEDRARELQQFIDDLSHEMNTPLTSIGGYAEFLIRANASEEQKQKAAQTIQSEATRMKDIYNKLLTLSFAREQDLELSSVKTSDLFTKVTETFLPQLQEQNIHLEIEATLDQITVDPTLIHILLGNLLKNSIQAIQRNGTITLLAYSHNKTAILEVHDNGCGIPKDKINDVIKPFFRVDKSRSRKTGGAGLGLSICKSIADLHHAELEITSEEGLGTSIKIIFYNSVTTPLFP